MNNSDVIVGWVGLSLALVVGYGAYKNKPVFGPNGIVTTAVQTGNIGGSGKPAPSVPNHSVYVPGRGLVDPAPSPGWSTAAYTAPTPAVAPAAPSSGGKGFLSELGSMLKGLFGGTPVPTPSGSVIYA